MPEHAPKSSPGLVLLLPSNDCCQALTEAVAALGTRDVQIACLAVASDWRAELGRLQQEFGHRTLLRVRRADLWLAADALLRLLKGAAGCTGPVTSLTNLDLQLTPAAPDCSLDALEPAALDAAAFALSQRRRFELTAQQPALLALSAGGDAAAALSVLDHVYAHAPDVPVVGLVTPADRRERAPAHALACLRQRLHENAGNGAGPWSQATRDERPVVLHILHGWGGGAERFVRDLASTDQERHHLLLRATGNPGRRLHGEFLELSDARGGPPLHRHLLTPAIGAISDRHSGYASRLAELIVDYSVEQIWVSSLIGHALDALRSGLPLRWIAHDYFPFWPALHRDFGDESARFDAAELAADLAAMHDGAFAEQDMGEWQSIATKTLDLLHSNGAEVVAPGSSVLRNLDRVAPGFHRLSQRSIGHGTASWPDAPQVCAQLSASIPKLRGGQRLRILVLGRINGAKGLNLLRELLPRLGGRCEVFLIGAGKAAEALFAVSGVHIVLDYEHAQLPGILSYIKPHAALMPSTVSETFSYTLSELWDLGIPPIATRLGAYAERITDGRDGILIDPDCEQIEALLLDLARDLQPLEQIRTHLASRVSRSLIEMLNDYVELLPQGLRAPLRYQIGNAQASELAIAVLADTVNDQKLQLDLALARINQQDSELIRRADWGFALSKQVNERTRWALSLDQELARARSWLQEREQVHEQQATAAENKIRRLQTRVSDLTEAVERIMQEAGVAQDALNDRIHQLSETLELVRQEHAATVASRDQAEIEHAQVLVKLQRERDQLAEHHVQMLSSTSWRLTAPMRIVGQFLKRLRVSLRFRLARLLTLMRRLRGSVARRGLKATWSRARQELKEQAQQPASAPQIEHPTPAVSYPIFAMPSSETPQVSIIVPVYNQLHHTWQCLQALAATAAGIAFEVIAVDDGSSDATATEIPRIVGVRFHKNPENLGFIGACNAGANLSRGEFLFFLNNDTAVQAGWLEPLLRSFEEFTDVGLVGSKLVYPDGRLQEAGGIVFSDGSGWNYGRFDHPDDPRYNYPREADYCSGAAILIRKSLFDQFGGFDSLYKPAYYEDTDLAFKVRAAGLRVIYQPASRVVHFEGITSGTDTGSGTKRFQLINQAKFLERWQQDLARQPVPTDHTGIWRAATHRLRGRILLIDATTPTPDQDSGSVRYINLIRVLRSIGWACTFFADNRAYVPGYTDALRALGVEVQFHPWLSDPVSFFRDRGRQFDAIMVSRHYVACQYVELAREHAPQALLLFDTVDLHYLREQRAAAVANSEALARQAESTRAAELALIASCDVTLVVSPVERELLAREAPGQRVEVLSNIHEVAGRRADFAARRDIWFVGGFQHQPNVDAAIWFARSIWPRIRRSLPELRFHIVGSKITPEVEALAGSGIEVHGFVDDISRFLDGCRISVAPLRYGAGVKGKVNQSMAYGQPVVATPIAVEGMEIVAGKEALVAEQADDFADAVVCLYQDSDLWLQLSDGGLANIEAHFSFDAARTALARILNSKP